MIPAQRSISKLVFIHNLCLFGCFLWNDPILCTNLQSKLAPISNPKFTISFMEWAKDQQEVVKLYC